MSRRSRRAGWIGVVALLGLLTVTVALGLGGCSKAEPAGDRIRGDILTIYSGLPLDGPSAPGGRAVLRGEMLALEKAGSRLGRYRLVLRPLDDATPQRGSWDPGQTSINVHAALADPTMIGYLGDFNSGASAVAIPPLNRAGVAAISPTSTAVGLVSDGPGSAPGEPAKYYPTGRQTFVRLSPDDAQQATVLLRVQRSLGCARTFVVDDQEFDGYDAALAFQIEAPRLHVMVVGSAAFDPRARDFTGLALAVAQSRAQCVLVSALPGPGTTTLATRVGAALPHVWILATAPLAQPSFADPSQGGIPLTLDPRVLIATPARGGSGTAARSFAADYTRRFGSPGPFAAYGYVSMQLLLGAIARATDGGRATARRGKVLSSLIGGSVPDNPLGDFDIHRSGATTLARYDVYRLVGGQLERWTGSSAPAD